MAIFFVNIFNGYFFVIIFLMLAKKIIIFVATLVTLLLGLFIAKLK
jgi:hypothetical protein